MTLLDPQCVGCQPDPVWPDLKETERFLQALDPATATFTFQTFDDNRDRHDKRLVRLLHGTLEQHASTLQQLNAQGAGIFVTINATDFKGRKAANIVRVRALFLDLDGAPLPEDGPTSHIITETSPRRWHTYWRVKGVALAEFPDYQKALIERYGGDVSVHDLPRVMRLPGFFHRKGRPYLVRVIAALPGVYEAHEFEKKTAKPKEEPPGVNACNNDFGEWRELNTLALANLDIWVPEIFGANATRTSSGVWRVSSAALGRDLQEDLSLSPEGIKDFGVHDMGDPRQGKRTPVEIVMIYGKKTAEQAAEWLRSKLGMIGVSLDDFYAYMPMHRYIFTPSRETWPASSVNARILPIQIFDQFGQPKLDDKGEPVMVPASAWLDKHKPVEQMTWVPGIPMVIRDRLIAEGGWIERKGVSCFNLYRPPTMKLGDPTQVQPWLDHWNKIYPHDAEHILNWLAHRVQRPQDKINHALMLGGAQGIGKDTGIEPVKRAVGPWNCREVSPKQMLGRFNGFLKSVILRVNEARDLGDVSRFDFYDHMKSYTASPPDVLLVDEKYLNEHYVLNCCGVIITTNYKMDGIYLPADDRRHYVAWSELTKTDFKPNYWNELWGWYDNGGDCNVAAYLAARDISAFDPKEPPPKTQAFWDIVDANRAPEEGELADVLDALHNPDAVTLRTIQAWAGDEGQFAQWIKDRKNRRAIPHRLEKCGYVPVRNESAVDRQWKIDGVRQVVYAKATLSVRDRIAAAQKLVQGM